MKKLVDAVLFVTALACMSVPAFGQVTTFHDFSGGADLAANPEGGVVLGRDGRLYGTTYSGGASGLGTVFALDTTGSRTTLHEFVGSDGSGPTGRLVQAPDGGFYGTVYGGGSGNRGTIFRIDESGTFALIHAFAAGEGAWPEAGLILAADGFLYGTTVVGGTYGYGTVFRVDTSGNLSTLHSFGGGAGGSYPHAALVQSTDGTLYGTTSNGGTAGGGTVFKLTTAGAFSTIHSFSNPEGMGPRGNLIEGPDGSLFGTTGFGGPSDGGTVFRVTPSGVLTVLYAFTSDGGHPRSGLLRTSDGRLFGTTVSGGATGSGTVYSLSANGALTVIHEFDREDGASPLAALIQGSDEYLYGTTANGGADGQSGVVFRVTKTAPPSVMTYPSDGAASADMTQPIQWTSVPNVQAYYLYLGTTVGAKNLVDTGEMTGTSRSVTLPGGQLVYARLWTKAAGVWRYTDSTFTTAVVVSTLTSPANGTSNVMPSVTMQWSGVPGVQAYYLYVGTSVGAKNVVDTGETLQTSRAVSLPSGQTLYARMWTKLGGVWRYTDSIFSTATVLSTLTSPLNGAQIDPTHNFAWTTVPNAQAYYLYVGTSVGTNNVVNTGETAQTSYHAASLPAGTTLYARMWVKVGGVWRYTDSTFTTP